MARVRSSFLRERDGHDRALSLALGGDAYAAITLPKNSVARQLTKNAVVSSKVKNTLS